MKRSGKSSNIHTDARCMQCGWQGDIDVMVRSNTWYMGMVGVRAKLCSKSCQEAFDQKAKVAS